MSYAYGSVIGLLVLFMTARGFAPGGCLGVFAGGFLVARVGASPQIDRRGARLVGSVSAITAASAFALLPIAPTTVAALSWWRRAAQASDCPIRALSRSPSRSHRVRAPGRCRQ